MGQIKNIGDGSNNSMSPFKPHNFKKQRRGSETDSKSILIKKKD